MIVSLFSVIPVEGTQSAAAQVHAAPFYRGFADRNRAYNETSAGRGTQNGNQLEIFRSVHAPFAQSRNARPIGSDPSDD